MYLKGFEKNNFNDYSYTNHTSWNCYEEEEKNTILKNNFSKIIVTILHIFHIGQILNSSDII